MQAEKAEAPLKSLVDGRNFFIHSWETAAWKRFHDAVVVYYVAGLAL